MVDASLAVLASNALTARWVEVAGRHPGDFALSGAAVWPLLAALAAGASAEARAELERAIGMPAEDALAAATNMIATIHRAVGAQAAIGLWVRAGFPLLADWVEALPAGTRGLLHGPPRVDQGALDAWEKERALGDVVRDLGLSRTRPRWSVGGAHPPHAHGQLRGPRTDHGPGHPGGSAD